MVAKSVLAAGLAMAACLTNSVDATKTKDNDIVADLHLYCVDHCANACGHAATNIAA